MVYSLQHFKMFPENLSGPPVGCSPLVETRGLE